VTGVQTCALPIWYREEYSRLAAAEECEFLVFDDEASENVWKPIRELASTLVSRKLSTPAMRTK